MHSSISRDCLQILLHEADIAARRLVRQLRLPHTDLDDVRQDLLLDVIARLGSFDPARGSLGAFIGTVMTHRAMRIAAKAKRERLLYGISLDEPMAGMDGASRGEFIAEDEGFPFTCEAERAHALALLLLPFMRELIDGPTPLHMIEKPTPGTGASLMVEVIAEVALGATPSFMAEGRDDDEWRKRLTAKLRSMPAMVVIDNLNLKLDSGALSAALTMPAWEDRVLGVSEMTRFPIRCVWVATGNNPQFSHEMARRIVRIRLDAHVDQPWRRKAGDFRHADLRGWTKANRSHLIAACLTLGQAWIGAGRPRQGERSLGSFDNWAAIMGGLLDVAGVPGFLANLDETYETADAEGATWRAFIGAWWDRHGTADVATADLHQVALTSEPPLPLGDGGDRSQRTRLGKALGRMRDRIFAVGSMKLRVRAGRVSHQAQRWHLAVEHGAPDQGERGEHYTRPEFGEGGERFPEAASETGERGERRDHPGINEGGERCEVGDQRSPQRSPEIREQNQGSGGRGEHGERFSIPHTHTGARAHTHMSGDAEKRSPRSPCPLPDGNHCDFSGERGGEHPPGPGSNVPPAPERWWEEVI